MTNVSKALSSKFHLVHYCIVFIAMFGNKFLKIQVSWKRFHFLLKETCTLTFNATHTLNGIYAVALSIEDFPKSNIVIGGKLYTPNDPISLVPLQVESSLIILKGFKIHCFHCHTTVVLSKVPSG